MGICKQSLRGMLLASCMWQALPSQAVAQAASNPADKADTSTEIIVTAQKREERLLQVPVTVNVVGSDQLARENVNSLADLSRTVPALDGGGSAPTIRGVTTTGFARSAESAVAVVIDGVNMGRTQINDLFDLQRVEVLSGPQGMLFGKNASAGVISIVTKAPDAHKLEAIGRVELGDYGHNLEQLTLNLPLAPDLAVRVSLHNREDGGSVYDDYVHRWSATYDYGARARLLWTPGDKLKVNIIGDYDVGGDNGVSNYVFGAVPAGSPLAGVLLGLCGIVAGPDNHTNCADGVSPRIVDRTIRWGLSAQADLNLAGGFVATSITAIRSSQTGSFNYRGEGGDTDLLPVDILNTNLAPDKIQTFSQELRLTSPLGHPLEFVAGLYYSSTKSTDTIIQGGSFGGLLALYGLPASTRAGGGTIVAVRQSSLAAFGQASYHATDRLTLIAGARVTHETLTDNSSRVTYSTDPSLTDFGLIAIPGLLTGTEVHQGVHTDNFSWKLGAEFKWSPTAMTFFTATRGYKGPFVNDQGGSGVIPVVSPEIPMDYELGFKGSVLNNRLSLTATLFDDKVSNFQTPVFVPPTTANPLPSFAQGNAPYILTKGLEIDVFGKVSDHLNVNTGVIYNKATYAPGYLVACSSAQTAGAGNCSSSGATPAVAQIAGAPKWRALASGEYSQNVSANLTAFIDADFEFDSPINNSPSPDPQTTQPDQYFLGGRIGLREGKRHWSLAVFARNLLNNRYPYYYADPLSQFNGGQGHSYFIVNSPMGTSFGVTLDAHF